MDDEGAATGFAHGADKIAHEVVALAFVNADAVLHRHRQSHDIAHGLHTVGDQLRFGHQASTKSTALHAFTRAAAVQIDLVVTPLFAQPRRPRQISGFAAAQLQSNRVFFSVKSQMPRHITMQQSTGGDHLGVQQRMAAQEPMKVTAMLVRPVHHRGNADDGHLELRL